MEIGAMQIKGWDRYNLEIEKFDINLSDQAEIFDIMKVLSQCFWKHQGRMKEEKI